MTRLQCASSITTGFEHRCIRDLGHPSLAHVVGYVDVGVRPLYTISRRLSQPYTRLLTLLQKQEVCFAKSLCMNADHVTRRRATKRRETLYTLCERTYQNSLKYLEQSLSAGVAHRQQRRASRLSQCAGMKAFRLT